MEIEDAFWIRSIFRGEKVGDLIAELAERMYHTGGREHAIISLQSGGRGIVTGGAGGIDLGAMGLELRRVILHTHPLPTGPSEADFDMLEQLGQRSTWIYELCGGGLIKVSR